MGVERLTLDSRLADPANAPLEIGPSNVEDPIVVLSQIDFPPPDVQVGTSSTIETEGEKVQWRKDSNRVIRAVVSLADPGLPAATNLITNPSFEVDTSGWAA